jgi:hypothetical protein
MLATNFRPARILTLIIRAAKRCVSGIRLIDVRCLLAGHAWDDRPGPAWLTCQRCCRKIGN